MTGPFDRAKEAAEALRARVGAAPDLAVVLGSGWEAASERLGETVDEAAFGDLPHFASPTVGGHAGRLRTVRTEEERRVLVLAGRLHAYEGHGPPTVVHPVRAAVLAGAGTVVLTSASGGIDPELAVGDPVLVSDHLDLTGSSPLTGPDPGPLGPRFADLTDCWTRRLRDTAREVDPSLREGVYAGVPGPQFETPAEVRMLATLGAGLVGMSMVHEAVAAAHLGAGVLGLSLVTNRAAGLDGPPDHAEVLAVAARASDHLADLLRSVVARL